MRNTITALLIICCVAAAPPALAVEADGATLANDEVAYHWAPAQQGGGLIGIEDHGQAAGLLDPKAPAAPWWQVKLKDGRTIANTDLPCQVDSQAE